VVNSLAGYFYDKVQAIRLTDKKIIVAGTQNSRYCINIFNILQNTLLTFFEKKIEQNKSDNKRSK